VHSRRAKSTSPHFRTADLAWDETGNALRIEYDADGQLLR
jgi:hypothetical protein